jgi:predicted Zn-dependent protease
MRVCGVIVPTICRRPRRRGFDRRACPSSAGRRQSTLGPLLVLWVVAAPAALAITLVSVDQEIAIGRETHAQTRKEVAELTDAQVRAYVRDIGRRLAQAAPGPKYPYSFSVANYREINAFALPGGPVWINRGVLHAAAHESQVAGVLAHEIAHIAERHAADQLTKAFAANLGLGVLGAFLGNAGGAGAAQTAAGFLANSMFLRFSRDDEREADRVGLQILRRAGWDARGMVELFEVLRREGKRDPQAVETFFSSHPAPGDRIAALQSQVARSYGGRRDSAQFQRVKARLLKMSPARSMPRK